MYDTYIHCIYYKTKSADVTENADYTSECRSFNYAEVIQQYKSGLKVKKHKKTTEPLVCF